MLHLLTTRSNSFSICKIRDSLLVFVCNGLESKVIGITRGVQNCFKSCIVYFRIWSWIMNALGSKRRIRFPRVDAQSVCMTICQYAISNLPGKFTKNRTNKLSNGVRENYKFFLNETFCFEKKRTRENRSVFLSFSQ